MAAPGISVAQQATQSEVAEAQMEMFRAHDSRIKDFAGRLKLEEPWITYCRVEMNEAHAGHPLDGTLPFGIDYQKLNKDQLEPLIHIRGAYEEGAMKKCLADVAVSLKATGLSDLR